MPRKPISFPKIQRNMPLAPEGMEFFLKADGTPGFRKAGSGGGQKLTEHERLLGRLPEGARATADSIRAGLKGRVKAIGVSGSGGGQTVRVPIELGGADSVDVKIEKPSDLKTLDELKQKRSNRSSTANATRQKTINDIEDRIVKAIDKLAATKIDERGDKVSKLTPAGRKAMEAVLQRNHLRYQREVGTEGIAIQGGPSIPGTESNPYIPASQSQLQVLEPGDWFLDPKGEPRQWKGWELQKGTPPEQLYAEREKFLQKSVTPSKQKEPSAGPVARTAGGLSGEHAKSGDELKASIDRIKKALDRTGNAAVTGKARIKMINRWTSLKRELEVLNR
ncbi:MAG TPA: hypothetical protein ENI27_06030 [bacterium]|nr:hypothetical protein [bacterium]